MSCRVMSRGVGTILLTHIMQLAKQAGCRLQAEFITTERNRMMFITYRFAGFREVEHDGNYYLLEHSLLELPAFPDYVQINIE